MPVQPAQLLHIIRIQLAIARLGLDVAGVMQLVCEEVTALLGADGAAVELADGDDMVYRAACGLAGPQLGLRLPQGSSLSGLCVARGEPLVCADSESDARVDLAACRAVGLRSMLVQPLFYDGKPVGVLKAVSAQKGRFGRDEIGLLAMLTDVLAAAIYFATRLDARSLLHRATHDELTGLPNRSLFMERLNRALTASRGGSTGVGVVMIDMDGLKPLNDRLGHRAGDVALAELGRRLAGSVRAGDLVARLCGDEFAVLLTGLAGSAELAAAMRRLHASVRAPLGFEGHNLALAMSLGSAVSPADGNEALALLAAADARMYARKRQRKAAGTTAGACPPAVSLH